MACRLFNPSSENSFNQKFREKRFKFFISLLGKIRSDKLIRILDLGGTETYWERMKFVDSDNIHITLLNLEKVTTKYRNFTSIQGDATDLSLFRDKEFDIVFSNSLIEHLFSLERQVKMAGEARRVGKNYYIQTPNRYFPIEPHWMFPLFQFFPMEVRIFLTKYFDLGHYEKAVDRDEAIRRVREVRLLSEASMKKIFSDGNVYRETFLGMVKSITMYRFPES